MVSPCFRSVGQVKTTIPFSPAAFSCYGQLMIYVGTSGFSYQDWVGPVYPAGTRSSDFLGLYSQRFNALEINYTYYRVPTQKTMLSLAEKSRGVIRMAVKLTDIFTHKRSSTEDDSKRFEEAMAPLQEAGLLGCLLAQFPFSFKPDRTNSRYLAKLRERFASFPLVVEVRNQGWMVDRLFPFLQNRDIGFCNVDEPRLPGLLPPTGHVTSELGYVRFHGRNSDKWWNHDRPEERYDYRYSAAELEEWIPRLRHMQQSCQDLFVFFNNHFTGKAVDNASEMVELLKRKLVDP